jgi:hypothetical protein
MMTAAAATFRGQPLLVLVGLLGAWFALRVALWQPSDPLLAPASLAELSYRETVAAAAPAQRPASSGEGAATRSAGLPLLLAAHGSWSAQATPRRLAASVPGAFTTDASPAQPNAVRMAVGHTLLLAVGLSQLALPHALAAYLQSATPGAGVPAAAPSQASLPQHAPADTGSRWSGDAWLMVRQDTTTAVASGRPSYGRSQAGAVLRYRLASASGHAPQAYARASSALAGPVERDVVAGVSGRPLPGVPLRVAVEARISATAQGTELRPAAIAVTELPPLRLPGGLRGEAYVQGGYVGGRFATAFVDGQARVEGTVARLGETEVSAGAGAWGGAQKGAGRLDLGPTAAVSFRLGPKSRGRLAADYRIRVAGEAEPRSGPALTLSAGF